MDGILDEYCKQHFSICAGKMALDEIVDFNEDPIKISEIEEPVSK